MPPGNQTSFDPTDHLLPAGRKSSAGPIIGTIIIIALLIVGALYFWGAHLNEQQNPPPYIPGDSLCTPSDTFGPAVAEKKMANGCSICSYRTPIESTGETMTHVEKCPQ